ncbi:hypothetical protein CRUP_015775 [Coryphaenoides rupestris]|nr:hypothetical protein CRUP_015775 [Coryphaenoides rupestris]
MAAAFYVWVQKGGWLAGFGAAATLALEGLLYMGAFPGVFGVLTMCYSFCCVHYFILDSKDEFCCDTGFGHALAEELSDRGVQVFAGVLDVNGPGARELKRRGSPRLQVLQLDVTDRGQVDQALRHISAASEIQPFTTFRRCMEVNFLSAVHLCQVFLPLLRRSKGRILNVTSMGGEVPFRFFSAYGASKAALGCFSRVLRLELADWGVKVVIIQPAAFKTSTSSSTHLIHFNLYAFSKAVKTTKRENSPNISRRPSARPHGETYIGSLQDCLSKVGRQSPQDLRPVLDDMCHALMSVSPKPLYHPGRMARLLPFLYHLCPTAVSISSLPATSLSTVTRQV